MRKMFVAICFLLALNGYAQQNDMVRIDGGTFLMGSPSSEKNRAPNEGPQHKVTVSAFYIGQYPVTQAEYQEIMGKNPSAFKGASLPVEQVSWFEALEYCNKRSLNEGLTPVYTIEKNSAVWNVEANGYRLPTEAEWEYACRAGTDTPYYSGTDVDDVGWHSGNSERKSHPVGEKSPNAWGLYDMHGNVLEWCWDLLGAYTSAEQTNPRGAATGTQRVYRGGCWRFDAHQTRSAFRFGNTPNLRGFPVGFRVVRSGI